MYLFLGSGIRRDELCNIELKDVDLKERCVLIHGKETRSGSATFRKVSRVFYQSTSIILEVAKARNKHDAIPLATVRNNKP